MPSLFEPTSWFVAWGEGLFVLTAILAGTIPFGGRCQSKYPHARITTGLNSQMGLFVRNP